MIRNICFTLVLVIICQSCHLLVEGNVAVTPASSCGALPSITGGNFSDGENSIGAERKLTCDASFKLTGSDVLKCLEGGKWKLSGSCEKPGCGEKPRVKCSKGYGIEFYSAKCGDDGTWTTELKCAPICEPLPIIEHAGYSEGTNWIGSVREVVCDWGFALEGNSTVTCGADGKWSELPSCKLDESLLPGADGILDGEDGIEGSGSGIDTTTWEPLPTEGPSGNISCSDSNSTDLYWPHQRCDGNWDCENGTDEMNCPNKCREYRYPTAVDLVDCRAYMPRFYYDWETGKCEDFIYGGCAEVHNMFMSKEECLRECAGVIVTLPATSPTTTTSATTSTGSAPTSTEAATNGKVAGEIRVKSNKNKHGSKTGDFNSFTGHYKIDDSHEEASNEVDNIPEFACDPTGKLTDDYTEADRCDGKYECDNGADEFNCTRKCFGLPYDLRLNVANGCKGEYTMWFYDIDARKCEYFVYGACSPVVNIFRTERECLRECRGVFRPSTTTTTEAATTTEEAAATTTQGVTETEAATDAWTTTAASTDESTTTAAELHTSTAPVSEAESPTTPTGPTTIEIVGLN